MTTVRQKALTMADSLTSVVPSAWRDTAFIRLYGLWKIPMLAYARPVVEELNEERCRVRIPLRRRTKNHLGSMYFGVLAVGADCAGGLAAMRLIQSSGEKINLVFKDFKAEFLRRPEEDVTFVCEQGPAIAKLVQDAVATGKRVEMPVHVTATVPSSSEPVAKFVLTLSLKKRRRKAAE